MEVKKECIIRQTTIQLELDPSREQCRQLSLSAGPFIHQFPVEGGPVVEGLCCIGGLNSLALLACHTGGQSGVLQPEGALRQ